MTIYPILDFPKIPIVADLLFNYFVENTFWYSVKHPAFFTDYQRRKQAQTAYDQPGL